MRMYPKKKHRNRTYIHRKHKITEYGKRILQRKLHKEETSTSRTFSRYEVLTVKLQLVSSRARTRLRNYSQRRLTNRKQPNRKEADTLIDGQEQGPDRTLPVDESWTN